MQHYLADCKLYNMQSRQLAGADPIRDRHVNGTADMKVSQIRSAHLTSCYTLVGASRRPLITFQAAPSAWKEYGKHRTIDAEL